MHFNLHKYLYKSERIIDNLRVANCRVAMNQKKIFLIFKKYAEMIMLYHTLLLQLELRA